MRIVFLNGPPRSGKDEAGIAIYKQFPAKLYKMSTPLKRSLPELFGLSHEEAKQLEKEKDTPNPLLMGMSWRQAQIWLSEVCVKPQFGNTFFGDLAVRWLKQPTSMALTAITDAGFRSELVPIVKAFGPQSCLLVHLVRPGTSFEGDSRSYVELDDLGVTTVQINNAYPNTELFHTKIRMVLEQWIGPISAN